MTNDMIEKFVENGKRINNPVNIHFKQRNTAKGLFIQSADYQELKSKNFWRIVTNDNIEPWKKTQDMNLARIFNGMEFTRLSEI